MGEDPEALRFKLRRNEAPQDSGAPEQLKEIPLRRLGRSEDIADACVYLASDASSYVTGDTIRVMGGRFIG